MSQLEKDINEFVEYFPLLEDIKGKSFCITGATGLIGSILVKCLLTLTEDVRIVIPVRSLEKATKLFRSSNDNLHIIEIDSLEEWTSKIEDSFNYIIHCASPTSGKYMEQFPLETFQLAYQTTFNLLDYARRSMIDSFVYISSVEYYGQVLDDKLLAEDAQGYVDPFSSRSSYPMGKRTAEYLCFAFAEEYDVPAKVVRPTLTFGAGISENDNRVFAQFARSVIQGDDIILHTTGESSKPYCYTTDCISAILYVLLKGKNGEAYNVANEETYVSIKELAEFLRDYFNPQIHIKTEINPNLGYAPITKLRLSTDKLRTLGWAPRVGLFDMFDRLIKSLQE